MNTRLTLLSTIFALCLAGGQILFKLAANSWVGADRGNSSLIGLLTPALLAAFALYGATALLWIYILRTAPLSQAYIFSIAGSALVPLAAWLIFKEPIGAKYWLGFSFMIFGIYLCVARS